MNYDPKKRYGYAEWFVRFPWDDRETKRRICGQDSQQFIVMYDLDKVAWRLLRIADYVSVGYPSEEWLFKYER